MGFMTSRIETGGSRFGNINISKPALMRGGEGPHAEEKRMRMRAHASASPVACAAAMLAKPSVIFWERGGGSLLVF